MKSDWKTNKLGELSVVGSGNSAPQNQKFFANGMYPFFRTSDVGGVKISKSLDVVVDYLNEKGARELKLFKKGTILIPKSGASTFLNHRVIMGVDGYVASHLATIETNDKILNNVFLFYYLLGVRAQDLIQDHKYPSLNLSIIKDINVSYPPLTEQKRIVKVLDEVFAGIEKVKGNLERNLENVRGVFEASLEDIYFGNDKWDKKSFGEIAKIKGGKRVPKGCKLQIEKTKYPYIRVTDFNNYGGIDLSGIKYIKNDVYEQIKRYTISSKDLYISIAGTIGKTGIVPVELNEANLTENACKLVFEPNVDNKFVYYFTKSRSFLEQAGLNTRTVAMPKLALSRLSTVFLFVPKSKTEQKQVVKKLDKLSEQTKKFEDIYKKKLEDLEELKKAVLKKAFSGEI